MTTDISHNPDTVGNDTTVIDDDDEFILPSTDADKPGFSFWQDSLTSRKVSSLKSACTGQWNSTKQVVELIDKRGKHFMTMGYYEHGQLYLSPEEALWLLDNGFLYLSKLPMDTSSVAASSSISSSSSSSVHTSHIPSSKETVTSSIPSTNFACTSVSVPNTSTKTNRKRNRNDEHAVVENPTMSPSRATLPSSSTTHSSSISTQISSSSTLIWQPPTDDKDEIDDDYSSDDNDTEASSVVSTTSSATDTDEKKNHRTTGTQKSTTTSTPFIHNSGLITIDPSEYEKYMSFEEAYNFLMQYVKLPVFFVYSSLRMDGFVVLHHRPIASVSVPTNTQLVPVFDVYARDGINTFRISAPGPPDFYVTILTSDDPLPHPVLLQPVLHHLRYHMYNCQVLKEQKQLHNHRHGHHHGSKRNKSVSNPPVLQDAFTSTGSTLESSRTTVVSTVMNQYQPTLKYAIVCHTTVTFYTLESVLLPPLNTSKNNNRRGRGRGGRGRGR